MALIAAAVGAIAAAGDDDARRPLVLTPGGLSPVKAAEPAGADIGIGGATYRYRLGIARPTLGSDAPVRDSKLRRSTTPASRGWRPPSASTGR